MYSSVIDNDVWRSLLSQAVSGDDLPSLLAMNAREGNGTPNADCLLGYEVVETRHCRCMFTIKGHKGHSISGNMDI